MPLQVIGHAKTAFARGDYVQAEDIARNLLNNSKERSSAQRILALSLYHLGRINEAINYAEENVNENATATSYVNLGLLLSWPKIAKHEEAADAYGKAFEISPRHPDGRWGWTQQYLTTRRWPEGWDLFEKYGTGNGFKMRAVVSERWDKKPLGDGKLLILSDQALGDTIQFSRFIPQLDVSNIRFECHEALASVRSW